MAYVKRFTKPYADGYRNQDETTQVTAEIKNMETETFEALEDFAVQTDSNYQSVVDALNDVATNVNQKADKTELPKNLSDLAGDATHRTVTDAEKETWNGKSDAFANKSTLDKFSESSGKLQWDGKPIEGGGGASSWSELAGKPFNTVDSNTLSTAGGVLSVIGGADGEPIVRKASGNPLKLSSVDAPLVDFIIHGYTDTTDGLKALGDQWGVVDLGDCDWEYNSNTDNQYAFQATVSSSLTVENTDEIQRVYCDKFPCYSAKEALAKWTNSDVCCLVSRNRILISVKPQIATSASVFKTYVKGVKLYYRLADDATPSMYAVRVDERNANLWDEEWENGYYDENDNGKKKPYSTFICCKNKIDVSHSTNYFITYESTNKYIIFFNAEDNMISYTRNSSFVTPANCKKIAFYVQNSTVYNGNIAIIKGTSGSYVPHEGQTVFIPTSQPLQDGDSISYHVDGSGVEHRKMGVVDLGSLNWNKRSDGSFENTIFSNMPTGTSKIYITICEDYESSDWDTVATNQKDKQITIFHFKDWTYARLAIRDRAYTDASAFKSAMSGKMLVYELVTPTDTPLTADQVAELKKLKTYADETNISTDTLASMDVTHYANNDNAVVVSDIQRQISGKLDAVDGKADETRIEKNISLEGISTSYNFKNAKIASMLNYICQTISANTDAIKVLMNNPSSGGGNPVGTIISYMGTDAPEDYLVCDGSEYEIALYPMLADHFLGQFGSINHFGGDGTNTFAVPDLRGEFLRGSGTNSHANQGKGADVGVHQDATELPRVLSYQDTIFSYVNGSNNAPTNIDSTTKKATNAKGAATQAYSNTEPSMITTRPTNTSVLYCIKASYNQTATPSLASEPMIASLEQEVDDGAVVNPEG